MGLTLLLFLTWVDIASTLTHDKQKWNKTRWHTKKEE